ncbi:hypothetical protein [Hungatella sp. SB206]|uniref:hypothetical protein n=1 Tax=Hungatella sp. SB206 TaxID=2937758 RepID=UPI003DA88D71
MRHGNEIAVDETAVNEIAVNEIAVNEIEAGRRRAVPWNGRLCGFGLLFFAFILFHFILSLFTGQYPNSVKW